MRFTPVKTKYKLTPESVDSVSEDVSSFLVGLKTQKKNIIETRLTVEEILLNLMDRYGREQEFTYIKNNSFGKPYISISLYAEQFNPLERGDGDEFGDWSSALIQNSDYSPSYSYDKGVNTVTIRFSKKEINPIIKLFASIVAAFLVSLLRFAVPYESIVYIKESVLDVLYNAFLGLMTTVEIPLVFLSVTCGIIGIGDSSVFGKIGRKMVLRFIAVMLFFTSFAGVVFSMFFTNLRGNDGAGLSLKVGFEMLFDLIPENLIAPIVSGNTMQIVLMAVIIGVTLVILGSKAKTISSIISEGNRIIVYITGLITKLLPFFIFVVLLDMIWSGDIKTFLNMWKPVVALAAVLTFLLVIMLVAVSSREKVSAKLLIKKMLPTFLIGIGTASSIAANGESSETLNRRLGVKKRFVDFGQPVGSVIFMPSTAITFMVCAIYFSSYYKLSISVSWFIIAIIICVFIAVATPPVPGGAIAAYTIIFSQLGIPSKAVAIVIALDILFDFVATAFDGAFLQLELVRQAEENNMLNYETLRKE
ncbi:MAG: dicarboxylate/amino acid:cation symporter [Eubacterium sp.]|nr:dicarboxylate/amino acid:cation symporter [Eubacterium sp.]